MAEDEFDWKYRSHFGLSVAEYENEPWDAIWQAKIRWSLEDARQQQIDAHSQTQADVLS